jgi:Trk-type K+ transport system membrane component
MLLRPGDRDFFSSLFQAASALGNCGLVLGGVSTTTDRSTLLVLMPLATLGGLGLPVLMDVYDRLTGARPCSLMHSRVVLGGSAVVFLVGLLGCIWLDWPASHTQENWRTTLSSSLVASINTRSAGLPVDAVYVFPRAMQWFLMALMLIGAAPGRDSRRIEDHNTGRNPPPRSPHAARRSTRPFAGDRHRLAGSVRGCSFSWRC